MKRDEISADVVPGRCDMRPVVSDADDLGIMGRPIHGDDGAFPSGSPWRMRYLGGALITDPVLWVCSGWIHDYPHYGVGPNDVTIDINPGRKPETPLPGGKHYIADINKWLPRRRGGWRLQVFDPPYSKGLAGKYYGTEDAFPNPEDTLRRLLENACPGGRVAVLDWLWHKPPKEVNGQKVKEIVTWPVTTGRGSRSRIYVVYELVLPVTWRKVQRKLKSKGER